MGLTLTVEEPKIRTAYDLIQEAKQDQQPLIGIPEGWKDIIYGRDGTGSADKSNDW